MTEKMDQGEIREAISHEAEAENHENIPEVCDVSLKKEEKQAECIDQNNGMEEKMDKDVEDVIDTLTNMIEHIALVEAPAVECKEKDEVLTQELDPVTEEVKEEEWEK